MSAISGVDQEDRDQPTTADTLAASDNETRNGSSNNPSDSQDANRNRQSNTLTLHCNSCMSLNPLIYKNIIQSPYFKTNLFSLKTYHDVIGEILQTVKHLEPWERGSRRVNGDTRQNYSGAVRGVAAGGIVSSAFCLLYKLYTLKLTRKQLHGLLNHADSTHVRGIGLLFVRYTQPPNDLWDWFSPFLDCDDEITVKSDGSSTTTISQMCHDLLTKLDWYSTMFPRIPVPIQRTIEDKISEYHKQHGSGKESPSRSRLSRSRSRSNDNRTERNLSGNRTDRHRSRDRHHDRHDHRDRYRNRDRHSDRDRDRYESRSDDRRDRNHDRDKYRSHDRHQHHRWHSKTHHRHDGSDKEHRSSRKSPERSSRHSHIDEHNNNHRWHPR